MIVINEELLNNTTAKAKQSARQRMNHNFHVRLDDPVNRFINAMEPDTYVRPHRHLHPPKDDISIILRGKAALFVFDDEGNVTDQLILDPKNGVYAAELPPEAWHSVVVLETGTVVYEVKLGPFTPIAPEDLAPWSPAAEDTEAVKEYMDGLRKQIDCP